MEIKWKFYMRYIQLCVCRERTQILIHVVKKHSDIKYRLKTVLSYDYFRVFILAELGLLAKLLYEIIFSLFFNLA